MAGESDDTKKFSFRKSAQWMPGEGMDRPVTVYRNENRNAGGKDSIPWLIIGGGVHGTYLSRYLTGRIGVPYGDVRVLDPYPEPLHRWLHTTGNTGMKTLRSPAPHHLDTVSLSIREFARGVSTPDLLLPGSEPSPDVPPFNPPYNRPSLELWNRHARHTIAAFGLERLRIRGRATGLHRENGVFLVTFSPGDMGGTGDGVISAHRVILALGMAEELCLPPWAGEQPGRVRTRTGMPRVRHIFEEAFSLPAFITGLASPADPTGTVMVVGSGMSAAQCALALSGAAPGRVTLLTRHPLRVHLFDSDREWQGRNRMEAFSKIRDPGLRRSIIAGERHVGSVTPEIASEIERARGNGSLQVLTSEIIRMEDPGPGHPLRLETDRGPVFTGSLLLATGFTRERPGGRFIDDAVRELELPVAGCGYPVPDRFLEWAPGLYVAGALADLELGPVARNISGAHRAAVRIAASVHADSA